MNEILQSLRTLLIDHLAAMEPLVVDLPLGGTVITVPKTSRLRVNDQVLLLSDQIGFAESSTIVAIPDWETLVISPPTVRGWRVSENAYVQKTVSWQAIQRIHVGDLKQIVKFPTITITPTGEDNEWMTLHATTHEYKVSIRTYVLADDFETSEIFLAKLSEQIREVLIDHIRPIIDGESHLLTADLHAGGTVVSVADTSNFLADLAAPAHQSFGYLMDATPQPNSQESYIRTVLSPTQLELATPAVYDYLVGRQAVIIRAKRMLYDSRPSSISYGYVPGDKGSFLRASEITWFGKEMLCRSGNILT